MNVSSPLADFMARLEQEKSLSIHIALVSDNARILGSGNGTIAATGSGTTLKDATNGIFTGTGGATGSFFNQGSGIFGTAQTLPIP
jgi:hypothetical protein